MWRVLFLMQTLMGHRRAAAGHAKGRALRREAFFFIFIFFKIVFYRNIFSISQFTGLYPYRPTGGRQGAYRPSAGRAAPYRPPAGR